jgi:hypothetical protein
VREKLVLSEPQHLALPFMIDNPRCALWAGCGLGKTSSTMIALDTLQLLGESYGPTLAIGPMRVAKDTWPDEQRKWTNFEHMNVRWIGGTPGERWEIIRKRPFADIYSISYELLPWLIETMDANFYWRNVVADESDRLKGFRLKGGADRAHAIARVAHTLVRRWINLTGTPAPEGLQDLWGQTWFLDRGLRLGLTHGAFMERWFRTNVYSRRTEPMPHSDKEIHAALADICLTLDPKDYFNLLDPHVTPIYIRLPPKARTIYKALEKELFAELESGVEVEVFNEAAKSSKLMQLANGAVYTEHPKWEAVHDEKIQALESIISECGGAQVLVAYQFISDKARILKAFPKAAVLNEPKGLARFKAGEAAMGIAHPGSMGHGIDGLQKCTNILVRFGHGWKLGERIQMLERIGPMRQLQAGFERVVMVYDILAEDTVDTLAIMPRHERKIGVQQALMDYMKRRRS